MAKRIKRTQIEIPEKEDLVLLMKQVQEAAASIKKIEADNDLKIAKIREKTAGKIETLKASQAEAVAKLEAWANANPDAWLRKKSMDLQHGIMGYRMGNASVRLKKGIKDTICDVLKRADLGKYVRVKEEVARDLIIDDRKDQDTMNKLKELGVTIAQSQSFYVQPKEEEYA